MFKNKNFSFCGSKNYLEHNQGSAQKESNRLSHETNDKNLKLLSLINQLKVL